MKPSIPGETTPKSSLSKSMKKTIKPRSKLQKTSHSASTPTSTSQETPTTSSTPDSQKDKFTRYYAGFGSKSIKVIWEQHENSDSEISGEVFPRLAEDATYKVRELASNLQTYARHSGGKVTCDLVNEVLRDSDVPPVLAYGDTDWDKIEYDGVFFFNSDKTLLLREEYLKELKFEIPILPDIESSWVIDRRFTKVMFEFGFVLCNAVFLGDEEAFQFGLETAAFSPHVGCALKFLLKKTIDILAFEQKPEGVHRGLAFLRALSINPGTRDADCRDKLFHLCEIIVCLLLDKFEPVQPDEHKNDKKTNLGIQVKKENKDVEQMDVSCDIKVEQECAEPQKPTTVKEENKPMPSTSSGDLDPTFKEEPKAQDDNIEITDEHYAATVRFSPYTAQMCKFDYVDSVCLTLGYLGSQFGYFQNECTFLIQKRMQEFFNSKQRENVLDKDFKYVSRCVRGLISLGELAFREMIPFLYKIKSSDAPDWIQNHFSPAAIFLHGRDDIFLYEWLEDLCGEKLQPFMLHFYNYHKKTNEFNKTSRKSTYKIYPKSQPKILKKQLAKRISVHDVFPDSVPLKPKMNKKENVIKKEENIVQLSLPVFDAYTVVARRKHIKPLTNEKKTVNLMNFCYMQI